MRWQDALLTAAALLFLVALVPTVLSPSQKPALATSVMNATVSATIAVVYFTLSLWFAALTTAANALLWLAIAGQTYVLQRSPNGSPGSRH